MRNPVFVTIALLAALLGSFSPAAAQYPFGKNKIQYTPRDWKVIETPYAEIFYYEDELPIANFIASHIEKVYEEYADYFNLEFDRKIPIVLYGTHHDFTETNIIPFFISEGTLGFTEFIKGRVALPFVGSYGNLLAVFRHEMVHVFMLEKLRLVMSEHRRFNYSDPPLWFTEGLAEYVAHRRQNNEAHMYMRDAVTSGTLFSLKDIWQIQGTYMMYKEGESVLHYIATRFGDDAIRLILENWWKTPKFSHVLEKTIGLRIEELDEQWREYLRRRYYPNVLDRRRITETAELLSPKRRSFENHPVCLTDDSGRERILSTGFGMGTIDVLELIPGRRDERKTRALVKGAQSTKFESIPLLRSRLSGRGDTLLFVSKAGERDAIYIYDISRKKVLSSFMFGEARILNSPSLSPEGNRVVFSAIDNMGRSDLFVHDLASGRTTRLTEDYYHDVHPDWHPYKELIVFSSDRCDGGVHERYALYTIDPGTGEIRALTNGGSRDTDPRWLANGTGLLFSSDREETSDIYLLEGERITRQTSVLGGAFDPFPCPDGDSFLLAGFSGSTFKIYRSPIVRNRPSTEIVRGELENPAWQPNAPGDTLVYLKKDYHLRFGLDLIGAAFSVDPDFGYMGNGAQLFLTDLLGNHQIIALFGSASDDFNNFWKNLNLAFTYINQENRLNYAFGAFHLATYMGTFEDLLRFERRYGALGALSYPISKFTRVEFSTALKWMERDDDITFIGLEEGRAFLSSNYISLTTDNIIWYIGGPMGGHRFNVSFGRNFDIGGSRYESTTLHVDLRNYIYLTRRIIFAQRFLSRNSWGSDLQLFYLGGSWDLRGYDFREFAGRRILLFNSEIRFPLLDRLLVGLPFGHIDFPLFRGSLFLDAGKVSGFLQDTDWLGSIGTGIEMNLGYLPVIRVNFSRITDFKEIDKKVRVDFFLGFNF